MVRVRRCTRTPHPCRHDLVVRSDACSSPSRPPARARSVWSSHVGPVHGDARRGRELGRAACDARCRRGAGLACCGRTSSGVRECSTDCCPQPSSSRCARRRIAANDGHV
jgi:hypothetical protein